MHNLVFTVICAVMVSSFGQLASAQMYRYEMNPYSSVGKVTGGKCLVHEDCINGYVPKGKKFALLCLTKKQAAGKRVDEDHIPANGLICGCLPDVKLCGYAAAQELFK
jgi:hypothetical protein